MKTHVLSFSRSGRQSGMTLLEVLVSIIILSVGLLGVASLQGMSKQSTYQASQRSIAMNLADGIVERIRANPTAASSYHTGLSNPLGNGSLGSTEPDPNCMSGTCTPAQLAAYDKWAFEQAIDGAYVTTNSGSNKVGGLLNPNACIVFTAATGKTNTGTLSVILSWKGITNISDAVDSGSTCGNTDAGNDASRRQLVFTAYLIDETEL